MLSVTAQYKDEQPSHRSLSNLWPCKMSSQPSEKARLEDFGASKHQRCSSHLSIRRIALEFTGALALVSIWYSCTGRGSTLDGSNSKTGGATLPAQCSFNNSCKPSYSSSASAISVFDWESVSTSTACYSWILRGLLY